VSAIILPDLGLLVLARSPRGFPVPKSRLPRELGGESSRRGELGGGAAPGDESRPVRAACGDDPRFGLASIGGRGGTDPVREGGFIS
jgi:hypothetical protein